MPHVDSVLKAAQELLDSLNDEIEKKAEEKPLPANVLESVDALRRFRKRDPQTKRSYGDAFRKVIMSELRKVPSGPVAVLLSSGVDSTSILCGLLALKRKPVAYSFTLDDRESTDFKVARETAKRLNVPFIAIKLPSNIDKLKREVPAMIKKFDVVKKSRVECLWPMMRAFMAIKEKTIVTGLAADGFFGLRRKIEEEYRDSSKPLDSFRAKYFADSDPAGIESTGRCAKAAGKVVLSPYFDANKQLQSILKGTCWKDVNKPKQKQPIRDAFAAEFKPLSLKNHLNFQVGDSGIADLFEKLLSTDLNKSKHKAVVALYRELANGKASR